MGRPSPSLGRLARPTYRVRPADEDEHRRWEDGGRAGDAQERPERGAGPAVYITPDIYLAAQVRAEADALGTETTDAPRSARFQSGKAILVTHVHKVINGRSVFGVVGDTRQRIEIGTVLVDDAHACLATVEDQFTLTIARDHPAYNELAELFDDALRAQSASAVRDLDQDVPGVALRITYWAWAGRHEQVLDNTSVLLEVHHRSGQAIARLVWARRAGPSATFGSGGMTK